jgi:dipeptidyl aminopeptidase/acylaminoacyl peptidase
MFTFIFRAFTWVLLLVIAGQALAKPIPIKSLSHVPVIDSVSMSADGKHLVALIAAPGTDFNETALATWDMDNISKGPVITPSGKRMKFIAANALKAGKLLVTGRQEWTGPLAGCGEGNFIGSTKTFVFKNYLTDANHKKFTEAFAEGTNKLGMSKQMRQCLDIAGSAGLVSNLPLDPDNVIIRRVTGVSGSADYFLYNLKTGESTLLLKENRRAAPGLFDPRDGKVLTRISTEPVSGGDFEQKILIRDPETGKFEVHDKLTTKVSDRYTVSVVGHDEKTGKYYVLTNLFSDTVKAWMYDPKTRKFDKEPLVGHPQYDIARLIFGSQPSNFNRLIGFSVAGPTIQTTYVDPDMRSIHEGLKQAYPGKEIHITGYNNDLSRVLFVTESAQQPPTYYLLLDRKKVQKLGSQRPDINSSDLGPQKWVTYTARDGMKIPAILDLPAGWKKEDGPLPTIILPHGGPWARDFMGWDSSGFVPLLTSRGYAVLRPQYRGSSGLGRKLWLAGDKQWGKAMQDDLDDGAKWLVEQGIADKDRLAIFGYSYGGFAAAAATVRPNSPYQCAIAGAPVTNLAKIGNTWSSNRLQRILQGRTVKGMDPMKNTDKAGIPVLLVVGDRDVRTPAWHAKNFYKDVKSKVPAKLKIIKDMPHQMPWYPRHHETLYKTVLDFLKNDCGPDGL